MAEGFCAGALFFRLGGAGFGSLGGLCGNSFLGAVVEFFDPFAEFFYLLELVLMLTSVGLGGDDQARRQVFKSDGAIGFVDVLTPLTA